MKANTVDLKTKARRLSNQSGFTILETTIALVVMMVLGLSAAGLFAYAVRYNAGANDRALSLALAQQRMERLRRTSFSDAALNAGATTEAYESRGRVYNIVTTICASSDCGGSATSKVITIQVSPAASSTEWARTPATIISRRSSAVLGQYFR